MKKAKEFTTKGYKVTDTNMKCEDYQFELGKRHKQRKSIKGVSNGFDFYEFPNICLKYCDISHPNRFFEVIAYGQVKTENDKSYCFEIQLVKELSWLDVLTIFNLGKENTGYFNSGDHNSSDRNSGDFNSGRWNLGHFNSGKWNSGDKNTGEWNSGGLNTGKKNTGFANTGNHNSGQWNTGNWNSGNWNSGDCNSGYRNSGVFCTEKDPKLFLFDKEAPGMTVSQWEKHEANFIMYQYLTTNVWIFSSNMSNDEKVKYPRHETTGGYLKSISMKEAWSNMWGILDDRSKGLFTSLPNFDKAKFLEITGINV